MFSLSQKYMCELYSMNQSKNLVVGGPLPLPSIYFSLLFDAFMISSNDVERPHPRFFF
jgi:hypothetical protein